MTCPHAQVLGAALLLALGAGLAHAQDWPEWCGQPSRNMAAPSAHPLPDSADCGTENDSGDVDRQSTRKVKWSARLGRPTTGSPVVSQGRVFIGTTWQDGKDACFLCFDEQTGRRLGAFICPKPVRETYERWAISSTPTVEGDRLYFISPYQEVLCLDLKTLLAAPADREKALVERTSLESIVWRYDLLDKLKAYYHHTASSSVLVHGDYLYVCTGNGRSWVPGRIPFDPLTPSLVVFDKLTGQLVARDDEQIGERLYRGQYASPSLALVNGRPQILFATGDGVCYAFEPLAPGMRVAPDRWTTTRLRGPIVHFIDVENLDTLGLAPAEFARSVDLLSILPKPALPLEFRFSRKVPAMTPVDTVPTATVPDVPILKKIWSCDCVPLEYMKTAFYPRHVKGDGLGHPCDIIATPVCWNNRVYVAIGGDPYHGGRECKGSLVCIDATQSGDVTQRAKIWSYNDLNQSLSTVAVTDGLVFVADNAHVVHCLDAGTGHCYWKHAVRQGATCFSSPLVADNKLYLGKAILSADKTLRVHPGITSPDNTEYASHSVANGVLFAVIGARLWAISNQAGPPRHDAVASAPADRPATRAQLPASAPGASRGPLVTAAARDAIRRNWPNLRGPFGHGIAYNVTPPTDFDVASGRNVRWKAPLPKPGASSPVVWEGRVFLTGADGGTREAYCFDADSGRLLWRHAAPQPADLPKPSEDYGYAASTGATDGHLFFAIFTTGDLVALDPRGAVAWSRKFATPKTSYGYASSLIVYKHLFVQIDDANAATLYALDPATGTTVWQKTRGVRESWASPIIALSGDRELLVLAENPTATAYDVATGDVVLSQKCLSGEVTPSPAYAQNTVVVANEYAKLSAISLASGAVAWTSEDDLPNVASPLATDRFVFTADSSGLVNCYDIATGRKHWTREFDDSFYPSPILAAGRIYALDNSGTLHVFQAANSFVPVARAKLGEESLATPAFTGRAIFLRTQTHLYCIQAKGS